MWQLKVFLLIEYFSIASSAAHCHYCCCECDFGMSTAPETACIDEALQEIFAETDLLAFQSKLIFEKQLTRLEHFGDVTDAELKSFGLSAPAVRRLRAAIERKRKKRAKLFGNGKRSVRLVQVKREPLQVERPGFEFNNTQPFLIPRNEIKLIETLGEGNFSVVKRALWTRPDGTKTDCAVKILHEMSEAVRQDLAVEISNMQKLRHQNLIQLFGVVFSADSTLMVIELAEGGSLLSRLRDQEKPRPLVTTLLNYAQQIATGMGYLESRRCVHRDLAARNVLLTREEQIIKICDFGLARALSENERLYIMQEPKKVPFSWCPPESLRFRQFSHKSDVWAFGVTMWELYTYGEEPWIGCRAAEVLQLIESGQRLRKPEYCPQELYEIMKLCWNNEAEARPKFSHLRKMLMDFKFMQIVCRAPHNAATAADDGQQQLHFLPGDEILLIGERGNGVWHGQSVVSRKFGEFPRTSVTMKNTPSAETTLADKGQQQQKQQQSPKNGVMMMVAGNNVRIIGQPQHRMPPISFPVAGSFIHTGHGDMDERQCWGHVDHIDQIYLKNPVIGPNTMGGQGQQHMVTLIPSVLTVHKPSTTIKGAINGWSNCDEPSSPTNTTTTWPMSIPPNGQFSANPSTNGQQHQQGRRPYSQSAAQTRETAPFPSTARHSNNSTTSSATANSDRSSVPSMGSSCGGQSPPVATLSSDAFEWISNELAQLSGRTGGGGKSSTLPMTPLNPPPLQQHNGLMSGMPTSSSSSKYDSSISIPRPNRTSPVNSRLTPPPVSAGNFTQPSSSGLKLSSVSLPSSTSTLNSMAAANCEKSDRHQERGSSTDQEQRQRPSSIHSLADDNLVMNTTNRGGDDPFWVKEDVKTLLNGKLPYKEVHKVTDFLLTNGGHHRAAQTDNNTAESAPETDRMEKQQEGSRASNVAVVAPFHHQQPPSIANSDAKPAFSGGDPKYDDGVGSLLPPPSQLLLSGFGTTIKADAPPSGFCTVPSKNGFQYQPIFDISGHSAMNLSIGSNDAYSAADKPRIRYGSNGIPILEPVPLDPMAATARKMAANEAPSHAAKMITLNELDTDALLNRVKTCVDFASHDQCRHYLMRNGFDVECAIRELKIEKLIEMGLATDRELAASALDSEKWDVNAAANRLCCS